MFSKWLNVVKDKELLITVIDMQENFVEEYLKFEDTSVGWYSINSIDERVVEDINSNVEEVKVVGWDKNKLNLEVSEKYIINIEMVELGYCEENCMEYGWEITSARKKSKRWNL
jgi:hypothetical protein